MNNKVENDNMTQWQQLFHMTFKWENKDNLFIKLFNF